MPRIPTDPCMNHEETNHMTFNLTFSRFPSLLPSLFAVAVVGFLLPTLTRAEGPPRADSSWWSLGVCAPLNPRNRSNTQE